MLSPNLLLFLSTFLRKFLVVQCTRRQSDRTCWNNSDPDPFLSSALPSPPSPTPINPLVYLYSYTAAAVLCVTDSLVKLAVLNNYQFCFCDTSSLLKKFHHRFWCPRNCTFLFLEEYIIIFAWRCFPLLGLKLMFFGVDGDFPHSPGSTGSGHFLYTIASRLNSCCKFGPHCITAWESDPLEWEH